MGEFEYVGIMRFDHTIRVDMILMEIVYTGFGGEKRLNGHKLDVQIKAQFLWKRRGW